MNVVRSIDLLDALVLRNPPPLGLVVPAVARRYAAGWLMRRMTASLPDSLDALSLAGQCQVPAVMFCSGVDRLVPPAFQSQVHAAYQGPKRVVTLTGLGHGDVATEEHRVPIDEALTWLRERTGVSTT